MYSIPRPFIMMLLIILMNHVAGIAEETYCSGTGKLSIGKMKPVSKIVGSIRPIKETNIAVCCVFVLVDIKMPRDSAVIAYKVDSARKRNILPSNGILKTYIPIAMIIPLLMIESTR